MLADTEGSPGCRWAPAELGRYTEGFGCIYAEKLEDIDVDVLAG